LKAYFHRVADESLLSAEHIIPIQSIIS